jgi:hypothetical protein
VPYPECGFHLFVPKDGQSPLVAKVVVARRGGKFVEFHSLNGRMFVFQKRIPILVQVALSHGRFIPLGAYSGDLWVPLDALKTRLAHNGNGH